DVYSPYWWVVRLFSPGTIEEAVIRFKPDGTPDGFSRTVAETYVRDPTTKALDAATAAARRDVRERPPPPHDGGRGRRPGPRGAGRARRTPTGTSTSRGTRCSIN